MSKQLSTDDILRALRRQKDLLQTNFHVKKIGLFGSYARNQANEKSDIDFLVEFEEGDLDYYLIRRNLHDFLVKEFDHEIDIAISKSLKPSYKDIILKQAIYA